MELLPRLDQVWLAFLIDLPVSWREWRRELFLTMFTYLCQPKIFPFLHILCRPDAKISARETPLLHLLTTVICLVLTRWVSRPARVRSHRALAARGSPSSGAWTWTRTGHLVKRNEENWEGLEAWCNFSEKMIPMIVYSCDVSGSLCFQHGYNSTLPSSGGSFPCIVLTFVLPEYWPRSGTSPWKRI